MAISSPNVQQRRTPDVLDYIQQGIQIGSAMQTAADSIERQRQFDVTMMEKNISEWSKDKMGLIQRIRENPDWFKNYLGKKFNTNMNSPDIDKLYQDLSTGQKSVDEIREEKASTWAYLGTTGQQQGEQTAPPETTVEENKVPAPVQGVLSGSVQKEETMTTGGKMPYEQFLDVLQKKANAQLPMTGGTGPRNPVGSFRAQLMSSPKAYDPNDEAANKVIPAYKAYKYYLENDVTPDAVASYYAGTPNRYGIVPTDAAKSQLPRETITYKTTTTLKTYDNVPLGNVENGTFKPTAETANANRKVVLDQLKDIGYKDMSADEFEDALYTMNEDALVKKYGSKYAAHEAFYKSKEWMKPDSGLNLKVADPVDLTLSDQMKMAKQSPNRSAAVQKAEIGLDKLTGQAIEWGYLSPDKAEQEWDRLVGPNLGLLAKTIDIKGPGGKERYKAFIENEKRIMNNITGGEGPISLIRAADPLSVEMVKAQMQNEQFKVEMDYRMTALGIDVKKMNMENSLDQARLQLGYLQLQASMASKDPTDKMIADAYDDLDSSAKAFQKSHPDWKGYNLAELVKQDPAAQFNISRLNQLMTAKYGGDLKKVKLRTKFTTAPFGTPGEYEWETELHPELLKIFAGDVKGMTESGQPAVGPVKRSKEFSGVAGRYGVNLDKTE